MMALRQHDTADGPGRRVRQTPIGLVLQRRTYLDTYGTTPPAKAASNLVRPLSKALSLK